MSPNKVAQMVSISPTDVSQMVSMSPTCVAQMVSMGPNKVVQMGIYVNYFLPSIRFLLTVHDINSSDVIKLDNYTHKFLKKWSGIRKSGKNLFFI